MILFTVGDDIYGRFPAVSSRHGFNRYRLVDHPGDERRADRRRRTEAEGRAACGKRAGAPPGKRWVGDTCRRHEMTPPNGRVPALVVAGGDAFDAAMFAEICSRMYRRTAATPGEPRLLPGRKQRTGRPGRTRTVL